MKSRKVIFLAATLILGSTLASCDIGNSLEGTIVAPTSSEDQQSYIEDLKVAGAYWKRYSSSASGRLNKKYANDENGYSYQKVENIDLNSGCGSTSDCNYLYESRTYDKSKAIRNIVAVVKDSESYANWFIDDYGDNYYAVAGLRVNGLDSSTSYYDVYDVNKGTGGKYVYIYFTRDTHRSNLEPITSIDIAKGAFDTISGYEYVSNSNALSPLQNLNEGNDGDDVFLGFNRSVIGWEIYNLNIIDYDTNGNMETKVVELNTKDKVMKEEYLVPFITKGEGSNFEGYTYHDDSEVKIGDAIEYNNIEIYAKWTYNVTLDMSFFEEENITYSNINFLPVLPERVYKGYRINGWKFEGDEKTISRGLPLNHGGTLVPVLERVHVEDFEEFTSGYYLGKTFDEEYNLYTMYHLLFREGSNFNTYKEMGFRCALYEHNIIVDEQGIFREAEKVPTPVSTSLDISSLTADELSTVNLHAKFIMMCELEDIQNTIDYFNNEGKVDSLLDEIIIDLCTKEINRR